MNLCEISQLFPLIVFSQSLKIQINPFQPTALMSFLYLIHGFHNETWCTFSHAQRDEKKPHMLEGQQVYTNKCTELGRESRRGAAGACQDIYTPDVAFLQSACFRCSAALLTLP